ncbi:MAG: hypothetical protein GY757_09965 [bacterium]|nr:hypothetical protein [bacterium]
MKIKTKLKPPLKSSPQKPTPRKVNTDLITKGFKLRPKDVKLLVEKTKQVDATTDLVISQTDLIKVGIDVVFGMSEEKILKRLRKIMF